MRMILITVADLPAVADRDLAYNRKAKPVAVVAVDSFGETGKQF